MIKYLLAVPLLLLAATPARTQRCGDSLLLYLRDRDGRVLATSDFESAKVSAAYTVDNVSDLVDDEPKVRELPGVVKVFSVRAECGMKVARFQLTYKGREMSIRVLDVPGDAEHILLDGIVFREGTYEVDLGGRPLKNVVRNEGVSGRGADPADEIRWLIKDRSLRKVK